MNGRKRRDCALIGLSLPIEDDRALRRKAAASEATMTTENLTLPRQRAPRNKGRLIGQKHPLKPKDVWTILVCLQLEG